MIPVSYLQQWRQQAPWPDLRQVEQDLIICRALCDLFCKPELSEKIAFRGGTAINKLLFKQPLRYSEDIDLVQITPEPIGTTLDSIRDALAWLGKCNYKQAGHSTHLLFKFTPEANPETPLKIKVEINTREHQSFFGTQRYPFAINSDWYQRKTDIVSFSPEELFGTKLRALLQRRKNRDLFDLYEGLKQLPLDTTSLIACFEHYLSLEGKPISRAMAEQRMLEKLNRQLIEDIAPLLPSHVRFDDKEAITAFNTIWFKLITNLKGEPWKTTGNVLEELRKTTHPNLLKEDLN